MINYEPYKDGDKWTIDVDTDDELNYVWNVAKWLTDNATSVLSFALIPVGVTVLEQGTAQGTAGALLPAKMKVTFAAGVDAHCTARIKTTDGQQFDKTIWFKQVEN